MPTVQATLEYLREQKDTLPALAPAPSVSTPQNFTKLYDSADIPAEKLPLYEDEKPYWSFLAPTDGFDPDKERVDNLEFEEYPDIRIQGMREDISKFKIEDCGFEVLDHESEFKKFEEGDDIAKYKTETERMLKDQMHAVYTKCYDARLRKNVQFARKQMDLDDPLLIEGPARGVHNDITYDSGPVVINRCLSNEDKEKYLKPGYRFRIVNTWRTLNAELEDRPLALCDSRSVDPNDLVPSDRIIPGYVGEVYYLTHNPNHKWFWLEKQTPSEPFVFVMYDTKSGSHGRFCPHVSFVNPTASENASPRESIETRVIVITKE